MNTVALCLFHLLALQTVFADALSSCLTLRMTGTAVRLTLTERPWVSLSTVTVIATSILVSAQTSIP